MTDNTNQGLRQAAARAVSGTTLDYNGDFMAMFDHDGIAAGDFNGRLLAWINLKLSASYTEINGAMNAFAISQGVNSWNELGTFTTGPLSYILLSDGVSYLLLTDGVSKLIRAR